MTVEMKALVVRLSLGLPRYLQELIDHGSVLNAREALDASKMRRRASQAGPELTKELDRPA